MHPPSSYFQVFVDCTVAIIVGLIVCWNTPRIVDALTGLQPRKGKGKR